MSFFLLRSHFIDSNFFLASSSLSISLKGVCQLKQVFEATELTLPRRLGKMASSLSATVSSPEEQKWAALSQQAWRYEAWLHTWSLNRSTVLDYFKFSDFYDRTCNNEIAIMQTMNADAMKLMEGIEYEVDPLSTDEFFLIRKSYRIDPNTTHLLALYFVIGVDNATGDPQMLPRGTVVPMPDLHSVLKTNLSTSFLFLKSAFDDLNSHVAFHPAVHGYQWSWNADKEKTEKEKQENDSPGTITVPPQTVQPRHQFSNLIDSAILSISQPILPPQPQTQQR